jgi:hypothetical protein
MNPTPATAPSVPLPPAASLHAAAARFASLRSKARLGIWVEATSLGALLLVAFALPSFLTDRGLRLEWIYRFVLLGTFVAVVVRVLLRRLVRPLAVRLDDDEMALAVERNVPATRQALISSLQFERTLRAGRPCGADSPALMAAVIEDVRTRLVTIPFERAIDGPRVLRFAGGLVFAVLCFGAWAAADAESLGLWARRNLLLSNVDWPRYTAIAFADAAAGEVRLPQGDALTVRITVTGPVPDQVFLEHRFRGGETGVEPMRGTGEREFTLTLERVVEDVVLRAEGGDALPVELAVRIVERPRVDELQVQVTFPDYMERDPELVPPTEGELRLPRGARLAISGRSQKPLAEAFLLFADESKLPLACGADGLSFAGAFTPEATGLLTIDVVDRDRLGAGTPPKLLLRVGDDKPPTLDFRLRGIGALITSHARIPGELKVRDDFGLRSVSASARAVSDLPPEPQPKPAAGDVPDGPDAPAADAPPKPPAPPPEVPFEALTATFTEPLPRSALRYETTASVDLAQWNPEPDENGAKNRIRPGMLVSLRLHAKDNFGPGEPHEGFGETMAFRVVTREKLLEDLRRRQVEQRQELQRIADEEQAALLELREMPEPGELGERGKLVVARLRELARRQQALGRRTGFVGESYQRLLWEYENNRLIEQNKIRQLETLIPQPLAALAKEAFPASGRLVEACAAAGASRTAAIAAYEDIQRRLAAVLREMEQAETLAALLEELRIVIKIEDSAIQEVESRVKAAEQDVFGPGKKVK